MQLNSFPFYLLCLFMSLILEFYNTVFLNGFVMKSQGQIMITQMTSLWHPQSWQSSSRYNKDFNIKIKLIWSCKICVYFIIILNKCTASVYSHFPLMVQAQCWGSIRLKPVKHIQPVCFKQSSIRNCLMLKENPTLSPKNCLYHKNCKHPSNLPPLAAIIPLKMTSPEQNWLLCQKHYYRNNEWILFTVP